MFDGCVLNVELIYEGINKVFNRERYMIEAISLDDVMNHFMMIFITYIVLFSIIIINFIKALYINRKTTSDIKWCN